MKKSSGLLFFLISVLSVGFWFFRKKEGLISNEVKPSNDFKPIETIKNVKEKIKYDENLTIPQMRSK